MQGWSSIFTVGFQLTELLGRPEMPCEQWCRLLELYRSAVNRYNEAANDLSLVLGSAFNQAWQRTEQARKKSENCRTELLQHEHEHGCLGGVGKPDVYNRVLNIDPEEFILGDQ